MTFLTTTVLPALAKWLGWNLLRQGLGLLRHKLGFKPEPLVWTSKGNLPAAQLHYEVRWEETPEYVKLVETYSLDGEVVRESAHALSRQGLGMSGRQADF